VPHLYDKDTQPNYNAKPKPEIPPPTLPVDHGEQIRINCRFPGVLVPSLLLSLVDHLAPLRYLMMNYAVNSHDFREVVYS
jgi:hypothetical protein